MNANDFKLKLASILGAVAVAIIAPNWATDPWPLIVSKILASLAGGLAVYGGADKWAKSIDVGKDQAVAINRQTVAIAKTAGQAAPEAAAAIVASPLSPPVAIVPRDEVAEAFEQYRIA